MKLLETIRQWSLKKRGIVFGGIALALVLVIGAVLLFTLGGNGGGEKSYTLEVKNPAGSALADLDVYFYRDASLQQLVWFEKTDDQGVIQFSDPEGGSLVAVISGAPAGYQPEAYYEIKNEKTTIVLPIVLPASADLSKTTFGLGDVFFDAVFTDTEGKTHQISELLKEKNAVVLNFFYTNCQPCVMEFPHLQKAWENYKDQVAFLALDPLDDAQAVAAFKQANGLSFPMAACEKGWESAMQLIGYPTTVVIDRYGMISFVYSGAFSDAQSVEAVFSYYGAAEYTQKLTTDPAQLAEEKPEGGDGSEDAPFEVGGVLEFDAKVAADGLVYYDVYKVSGTVLTIENSDAYVIYNGETFYAEGGVVSFPVTSPDTYTPVKLAIGNKGTSEATFHVTFVYPGGTLSNPYELSLGDLTTKLNKNNDQGVVYEWTAAESGTITYQVISVTDGVDYDVALYNLNTYANRTLSEDGNADKKSVSIVVNKGDVLQMTVGTLPNEENEYPAATIVGKLTFEKGEGTSAGNTNQGEVTYSITVKDEKGKALSGVSFQFAVGDKKKTGKTNASGVVSVTLPYGDCIATITVPDGYIAEKLEYTLNGNAPSAEIRLEELITDVPAGSTPTKYAVKLTDAAGKAQAGVTVQFYRGSEKVGEAKSDSKGVASITLMDSSYTLKLEGTNLYYDQSSAVVSASNTTITLLLAEKNNGAVERLYNNAKAYSVQEGSCYVDLTPGKTGYFLFAPTREGVYRFTTTSSYAKIGYYNTPNYIYDMTSNTDYANNAFTLTVKESSIGIVYLIGVSAASHVDGTILQVTRIGDAGWDINDEPWVAYEGKDPISAFTLKLPAGKKLTTFDLTADSDAYQLVYNESDGYYHLGSKNGSVVYVKLGEKAPYVSLAEMTAVTRVGSYLYDNNGKFLKKESYNELLLEYAECMDETQTVYPLTRDLEYILRQTGDHMGWWDKNHANYLFEELPDLNPELAWMFALYYVA